MKKYFVKSKLMLGVGCALITAMGVFFLVSNRQGHSQNQVVKNTQETRKITEADFNFIEDEVLRKHLVAQENVLKMRIDTTNGEEEGLIVEIDKSDPDNLKRRTKSFGLGKSESIIIGNTTYERRDDGAWKKRSFTNEEVEALLGTSNESLNEGITQKRIENTKQLHFEFIAKEKCGGLNCYKYKKNTEKTDELDSSMYFWFDDKEFLLRKELMETPEVSVTTIISYDNIVIVPPEGME